MKDVSARVPASTGPLAPKAATAPKPAPKPEPEPAALLKASADATVLSDAGRPAEKAAPALADNEALFEAAARTAGAGGKGAAGAKPAPKPPEPLAPPANAKEARARAEALWRVGGGYEAEFRRIEQDYRDVNSTPASSQSATIRQLHAGLPEEQAAAKALEPEQRAQYQRLASETTHDAHARLSLQALLVDGSLTANDGALLNELFQLAEGPKGRLAVRNAVKEHAALPVLDTDPAAEQTRANAALEETALEALAPAQQEQFQRVAAQTAADPQGRLALQLLLIEGSLAAKDGALLGQLDGLAQQELAPGLDRASLVSDLIQEVALPAAIAQHGHGTCTMASLQIKMAQESPAEYVRIVAGLASPEGSVRLAGGEVLEREPGTEQAQDRYWTDDAGQEHISFDPRTASSRLWQAALMEFGNGTAEYDNVTDHSTNLKGVSYRGLHADEVDRATDAVMGHDTRVFYRSTDLGPMMKHAEKLLDAGVSVPVAIEWGVRNSEGKTDGAHAVLVTSIDPERVHYRNPWGQEESMSREEFERRLINIHDTTEFVLPPPAGFAAHVLEMVAPPEAP